MLGNYLKKYAFRDQLIEKECLLDTGIIVVIPAHDEKSLIPTLSILSNCTRAKDKVEVIVVFNASETDENVVLERNKMAQEELRYWYNRQNLEQLPFRLLVIEENSLPSKHAGVGLARKIGMDEAVRRFQSIDNKNGILVCFDADSLCEPNYLVAVEEHFKKNKGAVSLHFEHPIEGDEFDREVYEGIYYYELHLRYYKNGLHFANLPYAYHSIGSSMAVDVLSYSKQGGMNRRKAGEDFYFLQKFIDIGVLTELYTTTVIPSPRASHRVPFGTGRAIQEMLDSEREIEKSYAFECFITLKECFTRVNEWYLKEPNWNSKLIEYYGEEFLNQKLEEIRKQSTNETRFLKRFFQWFNAFQCLKFIHFLRDQYFKNKPLINEGEKLLIALDVILQDNLLLTYRKLDKKES